MSVVRSRGRELFLGMAMGLAALVTGSILTSYVTGLWSAEPGPPDAVVILASQLWVLVLLPAIYLALARWLTPPPRPSLATVSAATGALFLVLFDVAFGLERFWFQPSWMLPRFAALVVGTLLARRATRYARA